MPSGVPAESTKELNVSNGTVQSANYAFGIWLENWTIVNSNAEVRTSQQLKAKIVIN